VNFRPIAHEVRIVSIKGVKPHGFQPHLKELFKTDWTRSCAPGKELGRTLWILEKGKVDQLDGNKEPVVYGYADLGFLDSMFSSINFTGSGLGTLTPL